MVSRRARQVRLALLLVRGRAVGVLAVTVGLLALWGVALAGPASAGNTKNCGSWHAASDITATGVSCHYVKSTFLPAYSNQLRVHGWKIKQHVIGGGRASTEYAIVATKGSEKITYHWKSNLCC